jgi:TPP-dependent 2-oxoacid decarboxylase
LVSGIILQLPATTPSFFSNQLLANKDLKQIYRTNELNFGFSAQGYARAPNATRGFAPLR